MDANNIPLVIEMLGKYPFKVFDRIALQILGRHAGVAFLIARDTLLDKPSFLDLSVRQEYDALATAIFGQLEERDQKTYLAWIDEGGDPRRFEGRDYRDEAIANAIEHWKFQRLSALKNTLPGRSRGAVCGDGGTLRRSAILHESDRAGRRLRYRRGKSNDSRVDGDDGAGRGDRTAAFMVAISERPVSFRIFEGGARDGNRRPRRRFS